MKGYLFVCSQVIGCTQHYFWSLLKTTMKETHQFPLQGDGQIFSPPEQSTPYHLDLHSIPPHIVPSRTQNSFDEKLLILRAYAINKQSPVR